MNKLTLLFVIVGIVIFTIIYLLIKPSDGSLEFVRSLDATPEVFNRHLETYKHLEPLDLTDTSEVLRPAHIKFSGDKVYISDFSDFSIYIYDIDGSPAGKIETKRGRGPGEFQHLTDFDVIRDTLWAVDSQNLTISSFSVNTGNYITSFSVDRRPARIACLDNTFIVQWMGAELLFSTFDYRGNERHQFGEVIENQMQHMLSLDGNVVSNYKDRFIYLPLYASLIYHYRENGELINVLKAPDGLAFPVTRRDGALSFAPDFSFYRNGWIEEDDILYVYTRLPGEKNTRGEWEGEPWSVFDRYNLITGTYEKSVKMPFFHHGAIFNNRANTIYSTVDMERSFIFQFENSIDF
ncbi:MAG: 6-bladed beta-propeller [Balneolaceae bacterium]|nr:6-bladed beta-propeller [Balneolaceae bacterium]